MAKILTAISPQAFELIRDQIAAILADEIDNQGLLTYDPDLLKMQVFVEAINPEDGEDMPLINVSLATGSWPDRKSYDGKIKGNYIYNIDVYCNSPTSDQNKGDNISAVKLQKVIGICRAILENPIYRLLGYAAGFIERVGMRDLNIRDENKTSDSLNARMGRLTFLVEVQENVNLLNGNTLSEWTTSVSVNQTDKGYYFMAN